MLFQTPGPMVEKAQYPNPQRRFSLAASLPPSSLVFITTGKETRPCLAKKVGDEDDKGSLDADRCWFELAIRGQLLFNVKGALER